MKALHWQNYFEGRFTLIFFFHSGSISMGLQFSVPRSCEVQSEKWQKCYLVCSPCTFTMAYRCFLIHCIAATQKSKKPKKLLQLPQEHYPWCMGSKYVLIFLLFSWNIFIQMFQILCNHEVLEFSRHGGACVQIMRLYEKRLIIQDLVEVRESSGVTPC